VAAAVAQVQAQAQACATAASQAQAEAAACAQAASQAEATAQATASAAGTGEAYAQAFAAAVATSSADVFAHAQAAAQAAAQAQAAAHAAAAALAEAQAEAASGTQAVAAAVAEAEAAARACAQAEAHAQAEAAAGVQAIATANANAEAAARVCAGARAQAEAQVAVGVQAIAEAGAQAQAAAHAAALAQAQAEAHVSVGVEAAAAAFADAAAAAYAAAGAEAHAEAAAYAAAQAMAEASAEAYASAQACALAVAQAQASATAVAEAYARAFASAEAAADALAQAHAMANAAAQAAATASTSVQIVPDIETSVRAIIDPECLQPVCEEYQPTRPCPPCPEEERPGCPETRSYGWEFGELTPGMRVSQMRSFPYDLTALVNEAGAVSASLLSSNVPSGLTLELILSAQRAVLEGQVPEKPGSYQVEYLLFDRNQCPVIDLTIYLGVGAPSEEPPPETGCPNPITLSWDFGEVKGGTFHFLTVREIPSSIQYQINSTGAIAADLISSNLPTRAEFNLDLESGIGSLTGYMPAEAGTYEVAFALYDQAECEVIRLRVLISVGGAAQEETPLPETQKVCVDVSAVALPRSFQTPTTHLPQPSEPEEISVQMVINGKQYYTTPFRICGSPGDRFTIQAEIEYWTQQEERFTFTAWQNKVWDSSQGTWTWVTISQSPFLGITLQQGGSLRAVYESAGYPG